MADDLTPQEVLQAIIDGKKLEYMYHGFETGGWRVFEPLDSEVSIKDIIKGYCRFRLLEDVIIVGNVSFPKPETSKPKLGDVYWVADTDSADFVSVYFWKWMDDEFDNNRLSRSLVHLSKENAIAHAKALIKLSGGKVDE